MIGLALLAGPALAQQVELAVLPIEVTRPPAPLKPSERDEMTSALKRHLRAAGVDTPPTARLEKAWGELKRQDCATEDACVAQFAAKASSLYALYTSVDQTTTGEVVVSGRIVRDDGKPVRPTTTVRVPASKGTAYSALVKQGLERLVKQLSVPTLPPTREAAYKPVEVITVTPVKETPPPAALPDAGVEVAVVTAPDAGLSMPPPPPPLESPLRTIGLVTAITGGAAALLGGAMFTAGRLDAENLLDENGFLRHSTSAENARNATTMQIAGTSIGLLGVAAAATGFALWIMNAPPEKTAFLLFATDRGASVAVSGVLPW